MTRLQFAIEEKRTSGISEGDLGESYQQLSALKDRIARRERKLKDLPDLHPDKKKLTIMIQKDKKKHQELSNKR